jgi:hypothetical protein
MRRVVVSVEEISRDDGWTVSVRIAGPGGGAIGADLVEPYRMAATLIDGRRVPATRPGRELPAAEPYAPLCTGDIDQLTGLLLRIRRGRTEPDDVSNYGRWLFECLLAEAWEAIRRYPEVEHDRGVELALRWPADAADLHRMVWEAMHDGVAPLAGHPDGVFAITRLVPAAPRPVRRITGIPSVLFATSVALVDPTIRPGAMYMGLLRDLDAAGRCRARAVAGISADGLRDACARWEPDVVHLVAHGLLLDDGRGAVMLHDDRSGGEREADAAALSAALSGSGRPPVAVVLSACNTGSPGVDGMGGAGDAADPAEASPLAAQLIARGIPMVSAMAGEVSESACRLYSRQLAAAVHEGLPAVDASAHGRRAALVGSAAPSARIDWALPALFLAEYVDPSERLIDPAQARRLTQLADKLNLRHEPVFIGRQDILEAADDSVDPGSRTGVIAITTDGSTARLGGTRLLQEIGWRVLRDGHVPLLLGPYQDARTTPTNPRKLVYTILSAIVSISRNMDLSLFPPAALHVDLDDSEWETLEHRVMAHAADPRRAHLAVRNELTRLRDGSGPLDPESVSDLLGGDLAELADRAAREWGTPFGEHTRAVLLCDNVHNWCEPQPSADADWLTGVEFLLQMLQTDGIGGGDRPSPVILTSSTTVGAGNAVGIWSGKSRPGFRVFRLDNLTPEESVVGYQWVLLHPWRTKPSEDRDLFGRVYTPKPEYITRWEDKLRRMNGPPTYVEERLYIVAQDWHELNAVSCDDDDRAWENYVDRNPDYRLGAGRADAEAGQ